MKYFNFLIENDINFSRDESGDYAAVVKVLNPTFFEKEQKEIEKQNEMKDTFTNFQKEESKINEKPRSSSQVTKNNKQNKMNKNVSKNKSPLPNNNRNNVDKSKMVIIFMYNYYYLYYSNKIRIYLPCSIINILNSLKL
jgi:hypothetical protein